MIFLDTETRSRADLKKVGAFSYARHWSTQLLIVAWKIDDGVTQTWVPTEPVPSLPDDHLVVAHNAAFDAQILRRFGWAPIADDRWRDSMAACALSGLPQGLNSACRAMGIAGKLSNTGGLIKMFSIPQKDTDQFIEPADRPLEFERFRQYCANDVDVMAELWGMLPVRPDGFEQDVWLATYRMNERGVRVDRAMVEHGLALAAILEERLDREAEAICGFKTTQVSKVRAWLSEQLGEEVPNLQAAFLERILERDDLPEGVDLIIEHRLERSKSSLAKLGAMKVRTTDDDDHARGEFRFHGAATGRASSSGIQCQNLIRPVIGKRDIERVFQVLPSREIGWLDMMFDRPAAAFASAIRGFMIPDEGEVMIASDLSAIELVLCWGFCDEHEALQRRAGGVDEYIELAKVVYQRDDIKKDTPERTVGKQGVLSCFEAGTLILTEQRGWVPIETVSFGESVFDGVEFVRCDGAILQGVKDTINLDGVGVTPDHQILVEGDRWAEAGELAANARLLRLALGTASGLYSDAHTIEVCSHTGIAVAAGVVESSKLQLETFELVRPHNAKVARFESVELNALKSVKCSAFSKLLRCWKVEQIDLWSNALHVAASNSNRRRSTPCAASVLKPEDAASATMSTSASACDLRKITGLLLHSVTCTIAAIRNMLKSFHTMQGAVSKFVIVGLSSSNSGLTPCFCLDTANPKGSRLTASTQINTMIGQTVGGRRYQSKTKAQVFDVVNAGPRRRFLVKTDSGTLIAHNCQYMTGAPKFRLSVYRQGVEIPMETAHRTVHAFRSTYRGIVKAWADLKLAIEMCTVRGPGAVEEALGGKVRFEHSVCGRWVRMLLPSGRAIHYFAPRIETHPVMGRRAFSYLQPQREWRIFPHGGQVLEHLVSGAARDVMMAALVKADQANMKLTLQVHDELVASGSEEDAVKLEGFMLDAPAWAKALAPIEVETTVARRYGK